MNLRPLHRDLPLDPPSSHGSPRARVFIRDNGCPLCRVDSPFGRCQRIDPFGVDPTLNVFATVTAIERDAADDVGAQHVPAGEGTAAAIAAAMREAQPSYRTFKEALINSAADAVNLPRAIPPGDATQLKYSSGRLELLTANEAND